MRGRNGFDDQAEGEKTVSLFLIDLTHMAEMAGIKETETSVIIGAAVTMDELERSSLIKRYLPALSKAASMVGSTQIRNRATIGKMWQTLRRVPI